MCLFRAIILKHGFQLIAYYVAKTSALFSIVGMPYTAFIAVKYATPDDILFMCRDGVIDKFKGYDKIASSQDLIRELVELSKSRWVVFTAMLPIKPGAYGEALSLARIYFIGLSIWRPDVTKHVFTADRLIVPWVPAEVIVEEGDNTSGMRIQAILKPIFETRIEQKPLRVYDEWIATEAILRELLRH